MTISEDISEACRACIDVKSWFNANKPKMTTSTMISSDLTYRDPIIEDPTVNKLSSKMVVCPPDSRELGRSTWTFLHTTAAYLPEAPNDTQKEQMSNLLSAVSQLYPCHNCAEHMQAYIEVNNPDFNSKRSISEWICGFHNEVNLLLGKETFDCSRLDERWKTGPSDDSCN